MNIVVHVLLPVMLVLLMLPFGAVGAVNQQDVQSWMGGGFPTPDEVALAF